MPRDVLSKEPESGSRFGWQGQLGTSPTSATRYSPGGESSRNTPIAGSHKQKVSGEGKLLLIHPSARTSYVFGTTGRREVSHDTVARYTM